MTNAMDGPIYMGLFLFVEISKALPNDVKQVSFWKGLTRKALISAGALIITVSPFMASFKPFVNGLAVNCPPAFMENKRIGPLIFETVDKCQKSPIWMMLILWGFFLYCGIGLWRFVDKKNDAR